MKAKLIIGLIAMFITTIAGWIIINNQSEIEFSELAKVNVKALANYESGGDVKLPCMKDDARCTVTFKLESGETST